MGFNQVLLVEDHPLMRSSLRDTLESFALIVLEVPSWKAMFEHLKTLESDDDKYDCILLDMEIEDMYGIDTWQTFIKSIQRDQTLAVCLTSPLGKEEMLKLSINERPDAVMVKPICRLELYQTLESLFNPHIQTPRRGRSLQAISASISKTGRILLVEDNEINQQVAMEFLKEHEFEITIAENGQEAIEILTIDDEYNLILMDIHMPIMDGVEATAHIRQIPNYRNIPIIGLTANVVKQDLEDYIRYGMNDVISKPFDIKRLFSVINKWIELPSSIEASQTKANDFYKQIEAIDWQAALARLEGKESILIVMLQLFKKNYTTFVEQLMLSILEEDWKAAKRAIHTLIGVAGSISANRLHEAASYLELAIMQKDEFHDQLIEVAEEIKRITAFIPDEDP
ncbi:response regulator [Paenibacillus frigoriresistens]|nr:response regulator [Paenibacillus frigoriresistens]